jgi:hypothetical protein
VTFDTGFSIVLLAFSTLAPGQEAKNLDPPQAANPVQHLVYNASYGVPECQQQLTVLRTALPFYASDRHEVGPSPTITILVYNNAQAPPAALAQAETEAGRILGEAGLRAVWLDCLDRHSAADPRGLCHKAREPVDLVLRLLPGQTPTRFQDTRFGISFLPTLASVYYEYAVRLARSENEVPIILGCAITHELGHLLLGPNGHSAGGIMQGEWGPKQLHLALMGGLLFTSQQSKLLRRAARARAERQNLTSTSSTPED